MASVVLNLKWLLMGVVRSWQSLHAKGERGQSTVEYVVVTVALFCLIFGMGALWHLAGGGVLADHAVQAASHHVAGSTSAAADVFSY